MSNPGDDIDPFAAAVHAWQGAHERMQLDGNDPSLILVPGTSGATVVAWVETDKGDGELPDYMSAMSEAILAALDMDQAPQWLAYAFVAHHVATHTEDELTALIAEQPDLSARLAAGDERVSEVLIVDVATNLGVAARKYTLPLVELHPEGEPLNGVQEGDVPDALITTWWAIQAGWEELK